MRNDRSAEAGRTLPVLALVAATALVLATPAAALAQEDAQRVDVLFPPSYRAPQEASGVDQRPGEADASEEVIDSRGAPRIIVVTAAPPPVPGWERPPEIEVVGLDLVGEVVVYSPAPEPMPGWRKLRGVDIRYHRIAAAPVPSRITTHSWRADAPTRIAYHVWPAADGTGIPYARTGSALVSQSWNPYGQRFEPSRIRYHGWPDGRRNER